MSDNEQEILAYVGIGCFTAALVVLLLGGHTVLAAGLLIGFGVYALKVV